MPYFCLLMTKKNYLAELNEVQAQAAQCTEGPVMIIAGAGSGKTRVLTYRIAHLIDSGAEPFSILALTFTNKAAKEMKERIQHIIGPKAKDLWMGTFHSVFAKILRTEAEKIGYPKSFTIYDTEDSKGLLKTITKELGLDEKVYKTSLVYNRISAAKNNLISAQAYANNARVVEEDRLSGKPKIAEIYLKYSNRCFKSGAMDFDDLLFKTNILLKDHPDVLQKYQDKFRYIMVDEYQDTNFSQYVIVKHLAARFENICVVGDDAQSIYSFRGANIQNILNFEKDYPDLKTFKLEQNYRSTQTIVEAANSIIANNKDQLEKKVWTANSGGEKIRVLRAHSDNDEGIQVARSIFETQNNNQAKNSDFAILYRTNAQSRAMEEALRKNNIPYKIFGGLSFYQRKEVKDILAYLRLAINANDEESLKRIINYPTRGIGATTIDKIVVAASDNDVSLFTVLENIVAFGLDINRGTQEKIAEFTTLIKSFAVVAQEKNAFDAGSHIAGASGLLKDLYADKTPEGVSRYENIQELLNAMKEFVDAEAVEGVDEPAIKLEDFIQDIALLTDADKKTADEEDLNKVSLMTIHSAKGLEFPYVYIVGLEENLFPSQMSITSRQDLEEERRLFYVALTRAERKATLSYATSRYKWGSPVFCEPSRFVEEIDKNYLEMPPETTKRPESTWGTSASTTTSPYQRPKTGPASASSTPDASQKVTIPKNLVKVSASSQKASVSAHTEALENLKVGSEVKHERFGVGRVLALEGTFPNTKVNVQFSASVGQKQLLLRFAKLQLLS